MPYKKNPFNSDKGKQLMKDIFNLMFISPEGEPSQVEMENADRQISHYKGNIINIVNKMRKFVVGYQQVPISESSSSGIFVCPHCKRRDPIWMWETVDAGHYSSPSEWISSVAPAVWKEGDASMSKRYQFVVRYRCNNATTCLACDTTVAGHGNTTCQNQITYIECTQCGKGAEDCTCDSTYYHRERQRVCGSTNLAKVGCGKESYACHFIREFTADDNHPQTRTEASGAVERNKKVRNPNNRRQFETGRLTAYEFVHNMVPNGVVVKTWEDIQAYTPSVKFTYSHQGWGAEEERIFPLSELNYSISKEELKTCYDGKLLRNGNLAHANQEFFLRNNLGRPEEECPECGATDYPPLFDVKGVYYRPETMRIRNPQPLEASTAMGGSYGGRPVYTIYLESNADASYKLLLPLPEMYNLRPIPEKPTAKFSKSGKNQCPNDVGGVSQEDIAIQEKNKELVEEFDAKLQSDADSMIDGETNKGYTFVVCEGRSRKAYYDRSQSRWVDDSPPCKSYIDANDGSTMDRPREYPRWTEIPYWSPNSPEDNDSNFYVGPNVDTHIVQDWIKSSDNLGLTLESSVNYHTVNEIGRRIDEDTAMATVVSHCETCEAIVKDGGIIPYRQRLKECDENGVAINSFPQEVLDAEIAFENSYPTKDVYGAPVPTAWGLILDSEHDGRRMLENPDLNIRIG